jgi:hypothetical protein
MESKEANNKSICARSESGFLWKSQAIAIDIDKKIKSKEGFK